MACALLAGRQLLQGPLSFPEYAPPERPEVLPPLRRCGGVPFFVDAMRPKSGTTSEMQDDGSGGKAHKRQGPIRRTGSLADRSKREPHRVRLAYESIFNRPPTETEIQAVPVFVKTKPTPQACWSAPWQSLWAGHEFLAGSLYENENSLFPPITLCVPSCGSRNGPAARCRL